MIYITYCELHRYFNKVLYYYRQLTQTMSPCSSIHFQKITTVRLVKNESSFIFHIYPKLGHLLTTWTHSAPSSTISLKSIFILSSLLNLGPPNTLLQSRYPIKTLPTFFFGSVRAAPPPQTCKYASLIWSPLKIIYARYLYYETHNYINLSCLQLPSLS